MVNIKKYFKDIFRTTSVLFISVLLTIGLVAFAITYPTTPTGQTSGGKFQEYFDKIFNGTCPEGLSLAGYDENKDPICLNGGNNIGIGPEGSVLTSTADGTYEWKFVGSLPKFQCSDEPAVNTKTSIGWTAVDVPSYCMDKRCMLKYEMYLDSTDALYTRRFTEYEQFTSESNKWWSEYNTAGTYTNGDTSSANVAKPFGDTLVLRDDKSGVDTSTSQFSVYDGNSKRYTKLYFCGDPGDELDTRDLTCNDFINTSTLTGWKSYNVPAECKTASGCELTVVQHTKNSAGTFIPGVSKQYHFEQRGDNRWESSAQGTKLFQLINGDTKANAIIPTASSGDNPVLMLVDDKKSGTYIEYDASKISVYDSKSTNSWYWDIKVCTYE